MANFSEKYNKLIESRSGNGRVSELDSKKPVEKFELFETINDNNCNKNIFKNIQSDSLLSNVFFSTENVNIIQNAIRYQIWMLTNKKYIIGPQCDTQLNIIMRSIFLQYSKNLKNKIKEQVQNLNNKVIDYSTKNIYNNLTQYDTYTKDITSGLQIMDMPKTDSIKGSKTFRMDKFI